MKIVAVSLKRGAIRHGELNGFFLLSPVPHASLIERHEAF
jgi:hypothetical protein